MKESKDWPNSKQVATTTYDSSLLELLVRFKDGGVYIYKRVPVDVWTAAKKAVSIGKFLNEAVKPVYSVTQIL